MSLKIGAIVKKFGVFLFGICFSTCLLAKLQKPIELANKNFHEEFSANVPVSGRVIAGLVTESAGSLSELQVNLAKIKAETICLRVQSMDGTYYSSNEYVVKDKQFKGLITPTYPTKYLELLDGFDQEELAILTFAGHCNQKKFSDIYVSARSLSPDVTNVSLLVSSGRSEVFLSTKNKQGKKSTIKCKRIEKGKRTAYDTECNISLDQLNEGSNNVAVLRRKSGRMLPSVKLNIVYSSLL